MDVTIGVGDHAVTIGPKRPLAIARDVFDIPISLPGNVRKYYEGVMEDPVEWARFHENKGAQLITLHLISTDPNLKNTSPEEAAETVSRVLSAIHIPLIISGSGNVKKDPLVLAACAKAAAGKNCLLSAVGLEGDYALVARAAKEYGHSVLALVSNDHLKMSEMIRLLQKEGLPLNKIVLDPATGALGYGLEYTISTMEKIREEAQNRPTLDLPILSASSNAWSSREAWLKNDAWGPREARGFLWESISAISTYLAGSNIFMMLDPQAMEVLAKYGSSIPQSVLLSGVCSRKKSISKILSLLPKNQGAEDAIALFSRKKPAPKGKSSLSKYLMPSVNSISFGKRTIGGEDVLHRHELRFFNPPPILVHIPLGTDEAEIDRRVLFVKQFFFERMGESLTIDGFAADDSELAHIISKKFKGIVVDLSELREDKNFLFSHASAPVASELFVKERLRANKSGNGKILAWHALSSGISSTLDAAVMLNRYANIIILNTTEPAHLIPLLVLRENLYSDPLAAPSVKAGLYKIGEANEHSPLLITTNFALTYYTVSNDIRKTGIPAHLLVLDTGGYAVGTSLALGRLSAESIAKALLDNNLSTVVSHKTLVLPGLAASLSFSTENKTGWKIIIAPQDSSQVGEFLKTLKSK